MVKHNQDAQRAGDEREYPVLSSHIGLRCKYLGAWNGPSQQPTEVEFFKISEAGYDKARRKS